MELQTEFLRMRNWFLFGVLPAALLVFGGCASTGSGSGGGYGPPPIPEGAEKEAVQTQWTNKVGVCGGCGDAIQGGQVVETKIGKFHAACYKCGSCGVALVGTPAKDHQRKPYCVPCYAKSFGPKCAGCKEPIAGGVVKAKGAEWHKACFEKQRPKCGGCGKAIKGGTRVAQFEGAQWHEACFRKKQKKGGGGVHRKRGGRGKKSGGGKLSMEGARAHVGGLINDYAALE